MSKILEQNIIVSDSTITQEISKLVKKGLLRKIASKVYTPNLKSPPEEIVKANLFPILGKLFPGAILSHRSAFEAGPREDTIYLTYKYTKKINLPGVVVHLLEGSKALASDFSFVETLRMSSIERRFLENLTISKGRGVSKNLTIEQIEEKLEEIVLKQGEDKLNELRDKARNISKNIGMEKEFEKFNSIISAILNTHTSHIVKSGKVASFIGGLPYDSDRYSLFQALFAYLNEQTFANVITPKLTDEQITTLCFFESYFSNYIEGTKFTVEEARKIIFEKEIPEKRPEGRDILGTYSVLRDENGIARTPASFDEFLEILKHRHSMIMKSHLDKKPGEFKDRNNQTGSTIFVAPKLVKGTLLKGFDFYQALDSPIKKSIYMMFLVAEVHPFVDGNGRLARVMMNSELIKEKQSRIVVTTINREDYLTGLKAATRNKNFYPYVQNMLSFQKFTVNIDLSTFETAVKYFSEASCFEEYKSHISLPKNSG